MKLGILALLILSGLTLLTWPYRASQEKQHKDRHQALVQRIHEVTEDSFPLRNDGTLYLLRGKQERAPVVLGGDTIFTAEFLVLKHYYIDSFYDGEWFKDTLALVKSPLRSIAGIPLGPSMPPEDPSQDVWPATEKQLRAFQARLQERQPKSNDTLLEELWNKLGDLPVDGHFRLEDLNTHGLSLYLDHYDSIKGREDDLFVISFRYTPPEPMCALGFFDGNALVPGWVKGQKVGGLFPDSQTRSEIAAEVWGPDISNADLLNVALALAFTIVIFKWILQLFFRLRGAVKRFD